MITRPTTRRAPRAPALLAAAGAAMLYAFGATAGTVQLRDTANLLTPQDEAQLRSDAQRYPFDVRILTTAEHADRDAFNRHVGAQVASGNMVVVGIDPTHRRTAVHFGNQTRIGSSNFPVVESAGNANFRQGDWRGGVAQILSQANSFVGTAPAAAGPVTTNYAQPGTTTTAPQRLPQAQPARRGFPMGGLLLIALIGGGIFLALRAMRRRAAGMAGGAPGVPGGFGGNNPFGGGPMQNQGGYGPGYGPGGMGMGRGGGLGGGLMGAGLGGLLGFGLGRATAGHHDDSHPAPPVGRGPVSGGDAGGWDAGGGTSDWGGGDGGGDAGGGGGSDW